MKDEEVNWDHVFLSNHFSRVTRGQSWYTTAIELVASAEALAPLAIAWWDSLAVWQKSKDRIFNEHSFHRTFMMLYAFAIENYLKGWLAERLGWEEREKLRGKGKFPGHLRTHDLLALAEVAGFVPVSLEDEALLKRLTYAAVWMGRYPVGLHFRGVAREQLSDGKVYSLDFSARGDIERIRNLAARIRDHVGAQASYRVARA